MRYRSVHPDFWTDKVLGKLSDTARLTYIGLWMLADDSGWMKWDPEQISMALFPWVDHRTREKRLSKALEELVAAGRVAVEPCGHARIPKLAVYQKAGHPWYAIREEHRRCNPALLPAIESNGLQSIAGNSASLVKGSDVSEVKLSNRASAHEESHGGLKDRLGDFHEVVPPKS